MFWWGAPTDGFWVSTGLLINPSISYTVGLMFTAEAETLPLSGGNPAGSAQGMVIHRPGVMVRLSDSALPLVNGEAASPALKLGDPQASDIRISYGDPTGLLTGLTRFTEDATAQVLGSTPGGIITLTQDLPLRTEICALFGNVQMSKV